MDTEKLDRLIELLELVLGREQQPVVVNVNLGELAAEFGEKRRGFGVRPRP